MGHSVTFDIVLLLTFMLVAVVCNICLTVPRRRGQVPIAARIRPNGSGVAMVLSCFAASYAAFLAAELTTGERLATALRHAISHWEPLILLLVGGLLWTAQIVVERTRRRSGDEAFEPFDPKL